jgi:hypothetical protein
MSQSKTWLGLDEYLIILHNEFADKLSAHEPQNALGDYQAFTHFLGSWAQCTPKMPGTEGNE